MQEQEIIEKLKDKTYVRAFGLMSKEEQEVYRKAGKENCLVYYGKETRQWSIPALGSDFDDSFTYAIKPDYQPEPKKTEDLTEDEMWNLTIQKYQDYCKEGSVCDLDDFKARWLEEKGFAGVYANCLFCDELNRKHESIDWMSEKCPTCQIAKVDPTGHCCNKQYHYHRQPEKFLAKLKEWNRIRLGKKSKDQLEPEFVDLEIVKGISNIGKYTCYRYGCSLPDSDEFIPIDCLPSLPTFRGFWEGGGIKMPVDRDNVARKVDEEKVKVYARFRNKQKEIIKDKLVWSKCKKCGYEDWTCYGKCYNCTFRKHRIPRI